MKAAGSGDLAASLLKRGCALCNTINTRTGSVFTLAVLIRMAAICRLDFGPCGGSAGGHAFCQVLSPGSALLFAHRKSNSFRNC
jgi:hypothetical protein